MFTAADWALCKEQSSAAEQVPTALQGGQIARLLWSAMLHASELHIFYNMSSLLWKVSTCPCFLSLSTHVYSPRHRTQGGQLETSLGSVRFAVLVAELLITCQLLLLLASTGLVWLQILPWEAYHQARTALREPAGLHASTRVVCVVATSTGVWTLQPLILLRCVCSARWASVASCSA